MFDLGTLYWCATSCLSLTPCFRFSWSYSRFNDPPKPDIPLSTDSTTAFRVSWYTKGISWTFLWSINFVSGFWIVAVMAPCSAQATCQKGDDWTVVYRSTATISSLLTFEYDAAAFFHCFQACIRGFFVIKRCQKHTDAAMNRRGVGKRSGARHGHRNKVWISFLELRCVQYTFTHTHLSTRPYTPIHVYELLLRCDLRLDDVV